MLTDALLPHEDVGLFKGVAFSDSRLYCTDIRPLLGTHGCVLVFRRFVVLRPPRPRLLGEAPSGDCLAGEVQPSRHTLIAVWCRCAHYGELNRAAAHVLKYLSFVVYASVMMRCNMAVAAGDRAMVVADASAMMRRNIRNRNPPPKGVHLNNRR